MGIVTRLICDGCGVDSGLDGRDCYDRSAIESKRWLVRWFHRYEAHRGGNVADLVEHEDDDHYLRVHYCPTCRRAIEARDLRTALTAPRKGKP
jgi:hypothetical protein